jgi:hypothetical protein
MVCGTANNALATDNTHTNDNTTARPRILTVQYRLLRAIARRTAEDTTQSGK